jgi:hypothetical protein
MSNNGTNRIRRAVLSGLMLAAGLISGCAMDNPFLAPPATSGKPMVWNCTMVQMSSPPKYACDDDKTYTAFQLRDFREKAASAIARK